MEPNDFDDDLVDLDDDLYVSDINDADDSEDELSEDSSSFYRSISEL